MKRQMHQHSLICKDDFDGINDDHDDCDDHDHDEDDHGYHHHRRSALGVLLSALHYLALWLVDPDDHHEDAEDDEDARDHHEEDHDDHDDPYHTNDDHGGGVGDQLDNHDYHDHDVLDYEDHEEHYHNNDDYGADQLYTCYHSALGLLLTSKVCFLHGRQHDQDQDHD